MNSLNSPDAEEKLKKLRQRFRIVTARHERRMMVRRLLLQQKPMIFLFAVSFIIFFAVLMNSPWPALTTVRHIGSFPDCQFARMFDLAPANEGEPGYHKRHDADNDGVSCEP